MDSIPIQFKEIIPDFSTTQKWREIVLNTGGTHSTLQDIKLPQRAGGYCYEQNKSNTRNRYIYWQTTADSIELTEASLDVNLSGAYVRCKVAAGTPPLDVSVWERGGDVVVLAATVSSVHRLYFPHPDADDKKVSLSGTQGSSLSIFHDANSSTANNPNNYYILPQYSGTNASVAHSCSSWLRANGEAVWGLVWGRAGVDGGGGLLLVRLPAPGAGAPLVTHLKRESTVPRFLSGLTGALRGKTTESADVCAVVASHDVVVGVCADSCLRVWGAEEGGAPVAVSRSLALDADRPAHTQGHKLQKLVVADGSLSVVAFLAFPSGCEFVVVNVRRDGHAVRFTTVCRIEGPQLELVDFQVSGGEESAVWALWTRPDGDYLITMSGLGAEVWWRAVAAREALPPLPTMSSDQHYRDRLFSPGLFPLAVIKKALVIYRRTWSGEGSCGGEGDVREAALAAVQARMRHLLAAQHTSRDQLMHKCWSELYSWCVQYMEGLQKPLGLIVSKESDSSEWCGVVRRGGLSFVRRLNSLERLVAMSELSGEGHFECEELSGAACRLLAAGARWERWLGAAGARDVERRLFASAAPQHRLLPRLALLTVPQDDSCATLTPEQIDDLTEMLEPIEDLEKAVLELNEALKLDVPDLDISAQELSPDHYDTLFSSDLGVSVVTETIRQLAELRGGMVRGVVGALVCARGAEGVPGAGPCVVHWQAYRALLWLRAATLHTPQSNSSDELFRLKLSVLGWEARSASAAGAVGGYAAVGGRRAARAAGAGEGGAWCGALDTVACHLAHQMWAVSGGFEFGAWLATINQPKLVQNYVTLLEPWCEWNACSRQLILGIALLDLGDCEGAYTAFTKAAKGVASEPFLRELAAAGRAQVTPHKALVMYYLKVIKLLEIHEAGGCVVRLAETVISIADKDDPNLPMFQWLVFKWHLSAGRTERALSAAAANPAQHARAVAAGTLLTTLASTKQLGALVGCAALAGEAATLAAARAKLHDPHAHNVYYNYLYALHVSRSHYRKASMVMYERATRCAGEAGGARWRRRCLAAALCCLRLADPRDRFVACGGRVLTPEDVARELREADAADPANRHHVETLLPEGDDIDYEELRQKLQDSDAQALRAVATRLLTAGRFLPHWLLQQYMEADSSGCARTLLGCGRAHEAAGALAGALRRAVRGLTAGAPPARCPLAAADLLRAELARLPLSEELKELDEAIEEYVKVVTRTSHDMKLARIQYPVSS